MVTRAWVRGCESNACIEALDNYGTILIRSSKIPQQFIVVDTEEWNQFIDAVKRGDFDEVGMADHVRSTPSQV